MSRSSKAVPEPQTLTDASYRIGPPPPPDTMELQINAASVSARQSWSLTEPVSATRTIYGKVQNLTGERVNSRELTLALRYDTERLIIIPSFNNIKPFNLDPGEVSPMLRLYRVAAFRPDKVKRNYPVLATIYDTQGRYSNTVIIKVKVKPRKRGSIFVWLLLLLLGSLIVVNRPRRRERQHEADRNDLNEEQSPS